MQLHRAVVVLTAAAALACGSPSSPPGRVVDVTVPTGFGFATSRGVTVVAQVAPGLIASDGTAAVVVATTAGKELYRRPILPGADWKARCAVATTQSELQGRLLSASGERRATAKITNGLATLEFK
jgi:hypothetical protein